MQKWLKYYPWILIAALCAYKFQDLSLPYFWDEAWSYFPALKAMRDAGPSLLPGAIHPDLYRGHPLLFYFLGSSFMLIFPGSIAWSKLFALVISCLLLLKTYQFSYKHFNQNTGILSITLLSIQSVFLAQASFLLPEMLLSLLTILAIDAFLSQQKWQTILWLSLALYTKESALVIALALICWQAWNTFADNSFKIKLRVFTSCAYLLLPFGFISLFFILQKLWIGWVFFPEHIGYISIDSFLDKANMYVGYLFIFRGRNLLTFFALASFIWLLINHKKDLTAYQNKLLGLLFFILSYLAFSSLNFYSPRYLLSVLPIVIVIFSFLLVQALQKYTWLLGLALLLILGNNVVFTFFRVEPNDHTLGYRDMIAVHKKMGEYMGKNLPKNDHIATHFLMKANLEIPELGYLNQNDKFSTVTLQVNDTTKWIVISNIEADQNLANMIQMPSAKFVQTFEQGACWVSLYRVDPK